MKDLIKDLKFIITASNDCEKDNKIEQLILDYIKQVETEKQLSIHIVSNCKHENEQMHQGDGFVYVTCKDCETDL